MLNTKGMNECRQERAMNIIILVVIYMDTDGLVLTIVVKYVTLSKLAPTGSLVNITQLTHLDSPVKYFHLW